MEKAVAQKEKEKREDNLRQLAQKVRDERSGVKKIDGNFLTHSHFNTKVDLFFKLKTLYTLLFVMLFVNFPLHIMVYEPVRRLW